MGHWFLGCSEHFGGGVNPKIPSLAWCHPAIFNSYIYNSWSIEIAVMEKIFRSPLEHMWVWPCKSLALVLTRLHAKFCGSAAVSVTALDTGVSVSVISMLCVQLSSSHESLLEKYLTLEQQVYKSQPASIVSELQLCVSKLQPIVDTCCAVLLKNETPDVASLLESNGLYILLYSHTYAYIEGCLRIHN